MAKRHNAADWAVVNVARDTCMGELKAALATQLDLFGKQQDLSIYLSFSEDGNKLLFPLRAYETLEDGMRRAVAHFERHQWLHAGELAPLAGDFPRRLESLKGEFVALQQALQAAEDGELGKGKALQAVRDAFRSFKLMHDVTGYHVKALDEGIDTIADSWGPLKATKAALAALAANGKDDSFSKGGAASGAPSRRTPRVRIVVGEARLGASYAETGVKEVKEAALRGRVPVAVSSGSDSSSDSE